MAVIEAEPIGWRELQGRVAHILRECGVEAVVEKRIDIARGTANIDVWGHDAAATPEQTYLIECKQWRKRVNKTVVQAFRTVVGDAGANWGAIVAARGFQRGARETASYSNVRLLTWVEFQDLFVRRWFERHFLPTITETADPLLEYTEPINSRIFRKADALGNAKRQQFINLRERHLSLHAVVLLHNVHGLPVLGRALDRSGVHASTTDMLLPKLPLRRSGPQQLVDGDSALPDSILDAISLRDLLNAMTSACVAAIAEFDEVFGERA